MQWIGTGRVLAEEADRVAHVLRAGRAVEADHVDLQRLERGQRGADVGAEQHLAAVGQQATPSLDRHRCGRSSLNASRMPKIGGLDLEDVLRGLDDDQVDAALEQALRPARRRPRRARGSGSGRASGPRRRAGARSGRSSRRRSGPRRPPCARSRRRVRLISSVCSPRPHSSSLRREAWNVSVSTTSAPASTIDSWTPWMTSGRLSTSASWQRPGSCSRFSSERSNCSSVAPMPPSKTTTRSRVAARKSRMPAEA